MARHNGVLMAGDALLKQSIERTRENYHAIRADRYAAKDNRRLPSQDRYMEQRLNSFAYQSIEQALLKRLEELESGMD